MGEQGYREHISMKEYTNDEIGIVVTPRTLSIDKSILLVRARGSQAQGLR
jgi:hypothetical protein